MTSQTHEWRSSAIALAIVLLFFFHSAHGQERPDLEVTAQTSSGVVRGGESFSYTVTVRNIGPAKAVDVILINDPASSEITSATPSTGSCERFERPNDPKYRCELGDLAPNAAVTIVFGARTWDFDEASNDFPAIGALMGALLTRTPLIDTGTNTDQGTNREPVQPSPDDGRPSVAALDVSGADDEPNTENNSFSVRMDLRPSANHAPSLEIVSPREDEVLTRPAKRRTTFALKIRAVDSDGTIDRVVDKEGKNSFPRPILENGAYKFEYQGKTYAPEEIEKVFEANPPAEKLARRISKDTFEYGIVDPDYGINPITVQAYDNLGRSALQNMLINVEGDATVEIVSPKEKEVIEPGSTITIEVVSKLNEGPLKYIELVGFADFKPVTPQLVSKLGNVYRHRYSWKTGPAWSTNVSVHATIFEDSGAKRNSLPLSFYVRSRPKIAITSVKNGDVFSIPQSIRVAFTASNAEGGEEYALVVDDKVKRSGSSTSLSWDDLRPGVHVIQIVARFEGVELSRSEAVTVSVR